MAAEKQRRRRVASPPAPVGIRLIRKYGNRRLYDTRTSRYVTLGDLVEAFDGDEDVKVVDAVSGEDLTKRVLAQAILFEEDRRRITILPIKVLRDLLRQRSDAVGNDRKQARAMARIESVAGGGVSDAGEIDELKRRLRVLESQLTRRR